MGSSFQPLRNLSPELSQVQERVAAAFEALDAKQATATRLASFVVAGSNGPGVVALPPLKDATGSILRRAEVGARLVAAVNLTSLVDAQASFAQQVTTPDQVRQTSTSNLSAAKFLIVVAQ